MGPFGVLYIGNDFNVALPEMIYHHRSFIARTNEPAGWTAQFREITIDLAGGFNDLRSDTAACAEFLVPNDYAAALTLGAQLRGANADGVVYPSDRCDGGQCTGLFSPDLADNPVQGRLLDYH